MATISEICKIAMGGIKIKYPSLINGVYDIAVLDEVNNE
jgi:hypothetical protein